MPNVNGKMFSYDKKGMQAAAKAKKKMGMPSGRESFMGGGKVGQKRNSYMYGGKVTGNMYSPGNKQKSIMRG